MITYKACLDQNYNVTLCRRVQVKFVLFVKKQAFFYNRNKIRKILTKKTELSLVKSLEGGQEVDVAPQKKKKKNKITTKWFIGF